VSDETPEDSPVVVNTIQIEEVYTKLVNAVEKDVSIPIIGLRKEVAMDQSAVVSSCDPCKSYTTTIEAIHAEGRALMEETSRTGRLVERADGEGRLTTERALATLRCDVKDNLIVMERQHAASVAAMALETGKLRELVVSEADKTRQLANQIDRENLNRKLNEVQMENFWLRNRVPVPPTKVETV